MRGALMLFGAAMLAVGCDSGAGQQTFRELALAPPSGFTRTDDQGVVLTADPADWQVSPLYGPASSVWVSVQPAYPNPVAPDGIVTLVLNVRTGAVVGGVTAIGYVERAGQNPDTFVLDDVADARGFVTITMIPAAHPGFLQGGGLRRIVVFDGQGEPVTYGDLMIE